jgi:hypothetical protein
LAATPLSPFPSACPPCALPWPTKPARVHGAGPETGSETGSAQAPAPKGCGGRALGLGRQEERRSTKLCTRALMAAACAVGSFLMSLGLRRCQSAR